MVGRTIWTHTDKPQCLCTSPKSTYDDGQLGSLKYGLPAPVSRELGSGSYVRSNNLEMSVPMDVVTVCGAEAGDKRND